MPNSSALHRFSAAVSVLNACQAPADLGPNLVEAMQTLFTADSHVVNWIGPSAFRDMSAASAPLPKEASLEVFNEHMDEHPLVWAIHDAWKTNQPLAGRWSDFTTLRQFRQKGMYHDFFRHTQTRHQLAATLRVRPEVVLGLSLNRQRRDFTAGDVELAQLFMRHVGETVRSIIGRAEVQALSSLHEVALQGMATLIVDPKGQLLFATEHADHLLTTYFPQRRPKELPAKIHRWLSGEPALGAACLHEGLEGKLVFHNVALIPWHGDWLHNIIPQGGHFPLVRCLRLAEHQEVKNIGKLRQLNLTQREAEVLYWLAEGKGNAEISQILHMKLRTVGKHCEHIFRKLSVENRSAAIGRAVDCY